MRVIGDPITVLVRHGQPHTLYWHQRRYPIRTILDTWRWAGRWWLRDPPRDYWLLDTQGLTAEIYRVRAAGHFCWVLARVGD